MGRCASSATPSGQMERRPCQRTKRCKLITEATGNWVEVVDEISGTCPKLKINSFTSGIFPQPTLATKENQIKFHKRTGKNYFGKTRPLVNWSECQLLIA